MVEYINTHIIVLCKISNSAGIKFESVNAPFN